MEFWLLFVLISSMAFALSAFVDRYVVNNDGNPRQANVLSAFFSGVASIVIALLFGVEMASMPVIVMSIVAGLLTRLGLLLYFHAIQKGDVTVVMPAMQMRSLFIVVLAVIFLQEILSVVDYIGIVLVFLGSLLLSVHAHHFHMTIDKYALLAAVAALFLAVQAIISDFATMFAPTWTVVFWFAVGNVLFASVSFLISHKNFSRKLVKHQFYASGLNTVAFICIMFAIATGPVSLVAAVAQIEPLFVLFFGVLAAKFLPHFYPEHVTKKMFMHRLMAITVMITGLVFITV